MKKTRPVHALTLHLAALVFATLASAAHSAARLNGVATHEELGQEQFIGGLYATTTTDSAISILTAQEEKRIQVRVTTDQLSSRRFKRMWIEGMAINSSPAELEKHAKNMASFSNMLNIKMQEGDIFSVDRSTSDVSVSINGVKLGSIDDPQFFDLLLRTWIGPVPLSSDFRQDLLAGGEIKPGPLARFESIRPSEQRIASIQSAVGNKAAQKASEPAKAVEVAIAPPVVAPVIKAPSVPASAPDEVASNEPVNAAPKLSIDAPTIEQPTPGVTPTPVPTKQAVALAPKAPVLDESVFEEEDEEFTAESLLKEQLYYTQLARYTHKFLKYPPKAWNRGHEGNIRMRVTINREGKMTNTEILEESKFPALNKEAVNAVERASPYPAMPPEIKGNDYTFTFRIAFKIVERK